MTMTMNRPDTGADLPAMVLGPEGLNDYERDRLSEAWGDLNPLALSELRMSLRRDGQQQPVLVDTKRRTIVDGWHRALMLASERLPVRCLDVGGLSRQQAAALCEAGNLHRRHSTRKELGKAAARQRLQEGPPTSAVTGEPMTVPEQAEALGYTSERQFQNILAATREELATPIIKRFLEEGEPVGGPMFGMPPEKWASLVLDVARDLDIDDVAAETDDGDDAVESLLTEAQMLAPFRDIIDANAGLVDRKAEAAYAAAERLADLAGEALTECYSCWPAGEEHAARLHKLIKGVGQRPAPPPALVRRAKKDRRAALLEWMDRTNGQSAAT